MCAQERQQQQEYAQEQERREERREGFDPTAGLGGAIIRVPGEGHPYAAQGGSVPGEVNSDRVPPGTGADKSCHLFCSV